MLNPGSLTLDECSGGLKVSVKVVSLNIQAGLVGKIVRLLAANHLSFEIHMG